MRNNCNVWTYNINDKGLMISDENNISEGFQTVHDSRDQDLSFDIWQCLLGYWVVIYYEVCSCPTNSVQAQNKNQALYTKYIQI
jgi:hypothetical protein